MKVLETERTTLRWFREDDAPFILALLNDPDWITNIGQRNVHSLDDARRFIADKLVATYWEKGLGLWAMERRSDGVLLGMCGLVDRDSLPEIDVGYALAPAFRGAGYAREGAAASLRYARDVLGKRQVLAIVWPENRSSIRVLEAVGMTSEGTRLLAGDPRDAAVFSWGARLDAPVADEDPNTAIDALLARFFAAFSNRSGLTKVASLPSFFVPHAVVTVVKPEAARGVETVGVRDFLTPRAALLSEGRLTDFHEEELTNHTEITGQLAWRSSRYGKGGTLDGVSFEGGGTKHFQLVRTTRGWKIAALAWEDDAERAH